MRIYIYTYIYKSLSRLLLGQRSELYQKDLLTLHSSFPSFDGGKHDALLSLYFFMMSFTACCFRKNPLKHFLTVVLSGSVTASSRHPQYSDQGMEHVPRRKYEGKIMATNNNDLIFLIVAGA